MASFMAQRQLPLAQHSSSCLKRGEPARRPTYRPSLYSRSLQRPHDRRPGSRPPHVLPSSCAALKEFCEGGLFDEVLKRAPEWFKLPFCKQVRKTNAHTSIIHASMQSMCQRRCMQLCEDVLHSPCWCSAGREGGTDSVHCYCICSIVSVWCPSTTPHLTRCDTPHSTDV